MIFKKYSVSVAGGVLMILGLCLIAASARYWVLSPDVYEATTYISSEKDSNAMRDYYDRNSLYDPYWILSEFERIQSKWLLFQVISNLNERQAWSGGIRRDEPVDVTYRWLKETIEVGQYKLSNIFRISVRSADPVEAATIGNEIADVYRKLRLEALRDDAGPAFEVLRAEVLKLDRGKLEEIKKMKAGRVDVDLLENAEAQLADLESVRRQLVKRIEKDRMGLSILRSPVDVMQPATVPSRPLSDAWVLSMAGISAGGFLIFLGLGWEFLRRRSKG